MTVAVTGAAGSAVEVLISGSPRASAVFAGDGSAALVFDVTLDEYFTETMRIRYVAGDQVGPSTPGLAPVVWDLRY